ncbi:MAG: hypothetical protein OXP75_09430, partial [Rhodospirillales bacterium]|nr:hypothetical protein [Rhodospirillales bacterium]
SRYVCSPVGSDEKVLVSVPRHAMKTRMSTLVPYAPGPRGFPTRPALRGYRARDGASRQTARAA